MRECLLIISTAILLILISFCLLLSDEKKLNTQIVTVVNNEVLISKSIKSVSCDGFTCYQYYANFLNESHQVDKKTYKNLVEGTKVTLTRQEKNISFLSVFLLLSIAFSLILIVSATNLNDSPIQSGEYYG